MSELLPESSIPNVCVPARMPGGRRSRRRSGFIWVQAGRSRADSIVAAATFVCSLVSSRHLRRSGTRHALARTHSTHTQTYADTDDDVLPGCAEEPPQHYLTPGKERDSG